MRGDDTNNSANGNGAVLKSTSSAVQAKPRSRGWIGFFVLLAAMTVVAISINIGYNISQQLKPAQLAAALAKWEANKPSDYDLTYVQKGSNAGTFITTVRGGKPIAATFNGEALETRLYPYHDMPALFADIERDQEIDTKPGAPRTFARALFDARDGHVIYYLRSVLTTRQRVEITVKLERIPQ